LIINEGRVSSSNLAGGVDNPSGTFAPIALTTVHSNFSQSNGSLEIEIGGPVAGTNFDKMLIEGSASLGGTLEVKLTNGYTPALGQTFEFLTVADGVTGFFDAFILPALVDGMWAPVYGANSVSLTVTQKGDFNVDGVVNAADYVALRKTSAQSQLDYNVWRRAFGNSISGGGAGLLLNTADGPAVPEPSTAALLFIATSILTLSRRLLRNHHR
jgi:hypothetical protein